MSSGEERSAEGWEKDPIWPIRGKITGKGEEGGLKETWRTGEVLIMV